MEQGTCFSFHVPCSIATSPAPCRGVSGGRGNWHTGVSRGYVTGTEALTHVTGTEALTHDCHGDGGVDTRGTCSCRCTRRPRAGRPATRAWAACPPRRTRARSSPGSGQKAKYVMLAIPSVLGVVTHASAHVDAHHGHNKQYETGKVTGMIQS